MAIGATLAFAILSRMVGVDLVVEEHGEGAAFAVVLTALVISYQWAEFVRRGDTITRDIRDYIVGFTLAGYPMLLYGVVRSATT